jgi:hypothetical protein
MAYFNPSMTGQMAYMGAGQLARMSAGGAAATPSFISQLGDAFKSVAPDMFRGIAAGLASYQGDPTRPFSGVGEAMAATMQRGEQTREARRKMSLMPEEAAAVAKSEVEYEKIKYEDDKDAFRALREMEGFRLGVPTDSISKGMMAYTAANPFSAVERNRMDSDMRKRLESALRVSF